MAGSFKPNLGPAGRFIRGVLGTLSLILAGYAAWRWKAWWPAAMLAAAGIFMLFEAARGWCVMRACGVRTRW